MTVSLTEKSSRPATADLLAGHTLLGTLVREVAGPQQQTTLVDGHLLVRLPHSGRLLRARVRRASTVAAHRFTGPVQVHDSADDWDDLTIDELARLIGAELTYRSGYRNDEFVAQVTASRDTLADILLTRPAHPQRPVGGVAGDYLDSEQALLAGHPRHPAPKWRSGDPAQWRRFAPETRTAFPLRWLASDQVLEHGDFDRHAGVPVPGAIPVHPWQFQLVRQDPELGPVLRAALRDGVLRDLGEIGPVFHPTASVRTLYQPEADLFLKTSLNVRITNCLRKNAAYELAGAVVLTDVLSGPFAAVTAKYPDFGFLPEPAARSVAVPELVEAFGTIARGGLREHLRPGERVHLVGTLAAEHPDPAGTCTRLADLCDVADQRAWAQRWWERYVRMLVPPVLRLWAEHGVVLEPHPQNVLVAVGPDRMPSRVLVRDLEGTKLIGDRHTATLAAMPADVALAAGYDDERGWNRIAYCLFVNNLTEVAAALADLAPHLEDDLWSTLSDVVAETSAELGHPPRLRALLAGVPLPAKTNLLVRWERRADRHAGYVPFPNPLGQGEFL
ncbi:iron transporter [Lentzea sp. NBRC 105346]|uniref:IucA/IucC family protein n=1 Tax=Lentzea sp. NBRC 105346 TaxID=3032205 RepID=UPI0024A218C4|nr:IucA/IucC family protein [Lentzea sp. NBRC 105346]GLZ30084.1 iron transporter [Lentzea sp. NBRC 105346]